MGPLTVVFGLVFIVIGAVGYFFSESQSPTALIPAGFGVAFVVLGLLARNDKLRMHVMHLAALLGLVAFVGGAVMVVRALAAGEIARPLAFTMQVLMALAAAIFVGLCVKSFIDARRARRQREAMGQQAAASPER
jgi:drug/metabolite transporter (DMT)-like permease